MHLESVGLSGDGFRRPFLLKELLHCLAAFANGVCLPRAVNATGICLVKGRRAVDIEADNERANAEGTRPTALRVLLLDARHVSSEIPAKMLRELES